MKKLLIIMLILFGVAGCSTDYSIRPISTTSNVVNMLLSDVNINESGFDGVSYEVNKKINRVKLNVGINDYEGKQIASFDLNEFENTANKKFVLTTGFSDEKGYVAFIQKDKIMNSESFYIAELLNVEEQIFLNESGYASKVATTNIKDIYDQDLEHVRNNEEFTIAYALYSANENDKYTKTYYEMTNQDDNLFASIKKGDYLVKVNVVFE